MKDRRKFDYCRAQGMIEHKIEKKEVENLEYIRNCAEKQLHPPVEESFSPKN